MCRIHGYIDTGAIDVAALHAVAAAQHHGGPDDQTLRCADGWALGNNRLAIQGLDHGTQPFTLGQHLTCVFNGEIYNHHELRNQLATKGYRFTGTCDGDVLLPLYELYGPSFAERLEGMYAIAIVDSRTGEPVLRLVADHAGMKSLYFYVVPTGLRFASELNALSKFPDFPTAIDHTAVDRYLGGKAIWGPETIYRQVQTLTPGQIVEYRAGRTPIRTTFRPTATRDIDLANPAETLQHLLRREMSRMLSADVPVCVITSGGLDSSYLTGLAASLQEEVETFNVAYRGTWPADERHHAAAVAAHCGTRHHQVELDPAGFPELIDRFTGYLDQPNNAPHSLSTFGLFEAVHAAGFKVAVTGDGADELFAGYRRFIDAAHDTSASWHRTYQATMAVAPAQSLRRLYTREFDETISDTGGLFTDRVGDELDLRRQNAGLSPLETLLRYDQTERFPYYILRRVDHLSMAHSVEARIPFLQPAIVNLAHSLPAAAKIGAGSGKAPVAGAARTTIPAAVIERPKQPFTLPIAAMMVPGQPLYDLVGDTVLAGSLRSGHVFEQASLRELFTAQTQQPAAQPAELLWSVLVLERWLAVRGLKL